MSLYDVVFVVDVPVGDPEGVRERVRTVLRQVELHESEDVNSIVWRRVLPPWLLDALDGDSAGVAPAWAYDAWVLSMTEARVWTVVAVSECEQRTFTVTLRPDSWPYSVGAVEYLVRVAGGVVERIDGRV